MSDAMQTMDGRQAFMAAWIPVEKRGRALSWLGGVGVGLGLGLGLGLGCPGWAG